MNAFLCKLGKPSLHYFLLSLSFKTGYTRTEHTFLKITYSKEIEQMVYDTKVISWNESLKQLQRRYTNQPVDRKQFEDVELAEFFHDNDYISLPTHISGLSTKRFTSYSIFTTEDKDRKVGTLIIEYLEDDNDILRVEQLYFV
ncbi:hypothetical protein bcere0022_28250 [Bacillus cereus Rock3-44]|nr:hypothetical protein bcere0022_28250 [Bacillus cereus Rock3-44]